MEEKIAELADRIRALELELDLRIGSTVPWPTEVDVDKVVTVNADGQYELKDP